MKGFDPIYQRRKGTLAKIEIEAASTALIGMLVIVYRDFTTARFVNDESDVLFVLKGDTCSDCKC